ncbi:MAG: hypothetical protein NTV05_14335 [Acidobacteria bacterium]|nr:hypothetical protein [Acidobacteriota bacterium]
MIRLVIRAAVAAVIGAILGVVFVVASYARNPAIDLNMDADLSAVATGFYPPEHDGPHAFVWTMRRADVSLAGIDRRVNWSCSVRFRGARSNAIPQPRLTLAADGGPGSVFEATNEFSEAGIAIPIRRGTSGLTLSLTSSSVMVPGQSDPRALGVQVDRIACRPSEGGFVLPPARAMQTAAIGGGAFGAALAGMGLPAVAVLAGTAFVSAAQAHVVANGISPFGSLLSKADGFVVWIAGLMLVSAWLFEAARKRPLRNAARFVVVCSAVSLYLKLLALVQPSKPLVDAVFHAHRFEWVLAGRFYFTQLSTSATPFPYAIGLYLFAAPWSWITRDYVTLLRVVVCATEVAAGALLYPMIVRAWGDRLAGAIGVALVSLLPLSFGVVGNANLTNAFGQSVALAAMALVTVWALTPDKPGQVIGLVLVSTLAFISHISTFALLMATLAATWLLFRWLGGPSLRQAARSVLLATIVAVLLAVALYWGHFGSVYRTQISRLGIATTVVSTPPMSEGATGANPKPAAADQPALGRTTIPLMGRTMEAARQTIANFGWPVLVLAAIGVWRLWATHVCDRLVLVVAAWGATGAAFLMASVLGPGNVRYQQDAWEFISRVEHATSPAAFVLAGLGASWAWHAGMWWRLVSGALLFGAMVVGARAWLAWIH